MPKWNSPEEVERILLANLSFKKKDPELDNLPTLVELSRTTFSAAAAKTDYSSYVSMGEYHYAVGRLLMNITLWEYGMFCAQQSIENYLKAYIKFIGEQPKLTHLLKELLQQCRNKQPTPEFIKGPYIEIIVTMFDPYNEVPRYPVQRRRPKRVVSIFPDTMFALDYFVNKMQNIVPLPATHGGLFKNGHVLLDVFETRYPHLYSLIKHENINFE